MNMSKLPVVVILAIVLLKDIFGSQTSDLLSVVVIYRHGARAPTGTYKNDPYNSTCYWGVDYGQLTNTGIVQMYELGKWLRNRYNGFLPAKYSHTDIKVISSDKDRCLMSAAANLAGLYPPEGGQVWNKDLPWQPIPIRMIPDHDDAILKQNKHCPKHDRLYREELGNEYFQKIRRESAELFKYVSEKSGENITNLHEIKKLFNIISVQSHFNVTFPEWVKETFQHMKCLTEIQGSSGTCTPELARLKSGPLIDIIITHFDNIIKQEKENVPKFLMYSAHDTTLINVMNSMQIYDYHWPEFASMLIFELRKDDEKHFVNILYKNSSGLERLSLKGCRFDCDMDKFKHTLAPVRISLKDWRHECLE